MFEEISRVLIDIFTVLWLHSNPICFYPLNLVLVQQIKNSPFEKFGNLHITNEDFLILPSI
jgi:hypothetical protein